MSEPYLTLTLKLIVEGNSHEKTEFFLTKEVMTIGRRESDIVLSNPSVSGRHVSLKVDAVGVVVTDFNSKNGTFINDRKIQEDRLEIGDILRIGEVKFVLENRDRTVTLANDEKNKISSLNLVTHQPKRNYFCLHPRTVKKVLRFLTMNCSVP